MPQNPPFPSCPPRDADDGLPAVVAFIRKLASDRYFGRVEFAFQSGHVVNIRQEQSFKPARILST